jgi:5-formyltetrahydrofolate cyclo-ligase
MINEKAEFRRICMEMSKFNRYMYSKKIGNMLYKIARPYKRILMFVPLEGEADILPVLKKLKREGKTIFVPLVEGSSFKMVKYSLPLKKKKFSIFEPHNKNETLEKIDLAVVPVVGIDGDFKRVGFGKGMYDRFFQRLKYRPKIVFLQLRPCIAKNKLTQRHDVRGDEYISFNVRRKDGDMGYSRFFFIRSRGVFYRQKNG